jgi:ABC-2 type transport system permease protein
VKLPQISPRRVTALIRKEGSQIVRDPSTFLIAFVLPMILLFLFGYAVSLDSSRIRVGLVVEDSSAPALRLAEAYRSSPYFEVVAARNVLDIRQKMTSGEVRAMIVIPQDFGRGVQRGRAPAIQIVTDGSQPNTANFAAAYGEGVRASWAAAEGLERDPDAMGAPVNLSARYWYNPELKSRYFLVPGSIAIVMTRSAPCSPRSSSPANGSAARWKR